MKFTFSARGGSIINGTSSVNRWNLTLRFIIKYDSKLELDKSALWFIHLAIFISIRFIVSKAVS